MQTAVNRILDDYESGRKTRREVLKGLTLLVGAAALQGKASAVASPFQATEPNHLALRVTDIGRSRSFYGRLLGMPVIRESSQSCFLRLQRGFLALFKAERAGLDHYCLAVEDFDVERAHATLQKEGLNPRWPSGTQRIYFRDPDGIEVQLSSEDHRA